MIVGTGIDAVSIQRIGKMSSLAKKKIFHPSELEDVSVFTNEEVQNRALAARFAAKEAYAKARGTGFNGNVIPSEIRVAKKESGAPYLVLYGKTLETSGNEIIHLSITHEEPLALAIVILEFKDGKE